MMRTYTRKRPKNQLIEDVHDLCRLCLNKVEEGTPIFTEDTGNVCATLALRIMICVGLEVTREDCLPNIICPECYSQLNKYYAFRKRCEIAYQKLKSHVLAFKENLYKQRVQDEMERKKKLSDGDNDELQFVVTFDKDQFSGANVLNLNGVAQVNHLMEQKLPDLTKIDQNMETQNCTSNTEEVETSSSDPDITTFLSTMLRELGILAQQGDGLVYANHNIRSLELETGDGSQVILELMEEDDEQVQKEIINESPKTIEVEVPPKENDCVVKYITSTPTKKKEVTTDKKQSGWWCGQCGARAASGSALARHGRTHSGERPYACNTCARTFAQKEVMLRHQLVHQEQRPYQCSECDKSFTQRGALAAHSRMHAPANARRLALHRCDRCPKVFLYASGLSRHMMMHKGRVYVCGACERQFRDKSSLLRHLKNANHAPRDDAT